MKKIYLSIIIALSSLVAGWAQDVTFRIDGQLVSSGGTEVVVPVRVDNFSDVLSIQGTVTFDPAVLSFVQLENLALSGLVPTDFGTSRTGEGFITFVWFEPNLAAQTLADNDSIFSIRFSVVGETNDQTTVAITSDVTPIEVANGNFEVVNSTSTAGTFVVDEVLSTANVTTNQQTLVYFPTLVENEIHFQHPVGNVEIMSLEGRILLQQETVGTILNVANLTSGSYILKTSLGTALFIKQ